ncbi:hypothetical protein HNE_2692 [Hyphomonas neptunium ATCC 15444]|uniref:Uncharacterized protein n=2 Tax=Hyphomonas TaxID=85 RepID=Q0BYS1_HYPNA|nr:hypothetical protein HNE_2692 [Hyphomonas neptunium ATCC 15444]
MPGNCTDLPKTALPVIYTPPEFAWQDCCKCEKTFMAVYLSVKELVTNRRVVGMTDVIVDFDVASSDEDMRLTALIDTFVEMQDAMGQWDASSLDLMVRTAFGPAGERLKQLIFQSREMAEAFCAFWMTETGLQVAHFPY